MSQYEGNGLPVATNLLSTGMQLSHCCLAALGVPYCLTQPSWGDGREKGPTYAQKLTKSLSRKWTDTHLSKVLKIVQSRDRYYVISHYPFPLLPFLHPCTDLSPWTSGEKKSIVHVSPYVEIWGSEGGGVRFDPGSTNSTST